jgi:spermidine/putrescine transport system substrate-binding protein
VDATYIRELARRDMERLTRRALLRRMGGTALAVAAGGNVLAACGGTSSQPPTSAGGTVGGSLKFLGISGEDGAAVAKPFLTKHHVTMQASYAVDLDSELTKLKTGGTSQFSVLTIPKDTAQRAQELDFVRPLDLDRLHNFKKLFPALQTAPWITSGGKTYGFPLIWGSEPCVYNPKNWNGMPPKYTDFADKKFHGALNTLDEPYGNQWLVARSLRLGQNGNYNRLTQAELNKVRDAWIAIRPNIEAWAQTYGDQTDLLVRGETSIALNSWQALLAFGKQKGVKLAYASPGDDGTYYWSDSYFITSQAPNAATAYAYIDYMTTPESNAKMAVALQSGATMPAAVKLLPGGSIPTGYDYSLVESHLNANFVKVILPPETQEGDIVGQAAWVKSWEQVKAA